MPCYYDIKLNNIDPKFFQNLLDVLNMSDEKLNAILMIHKDGYEIFCNRKLSYNEKNFLYNNTH